MAARKIKKSRTVGKPVGLEFLDGIIHTLRGQKVILDSDLSRLYGVSTKQLNQQVRRNMTKFPADFAFQLNEEEWDILRSQNVTASKSDFAMRSQNVTASKRNTRFLPWVFTEHGALQAANILNSKKAAVMSIYVIRAFVKMRQTLSVNDAILKRLAEIDSNLLVHDSALRDIYEKLQPFLSPPSIPNRRLNRSVSMCETRLAGTI